ncbi:2-hydroxychromene-2-carboxylate isomerase [Acuticoccus sp. I52.16.1]|uniref:2-hydroxychromene-2-carboxylate isomerase n=1 Tax=Acuticoccus sp. I52.16.1 TaxID=2928472 RepID=UPI001FD0D853|nr:DsbA family protein [Acuticoccus sp. I52.16.1]UOM36356.1 DsbA family protein [Acuticoccus sp. I52.16.1]
MAIRFFFDFSSSYSYLTAMRMEALADAEGIEVVWTPFLLGPIFAEAGLGGTPNLSSEAKGAFMWEDLARRAAHRGLPFVKPDVFPQKSVAAGRAALALEGAERAAFTRAVFHCEWGKGMDIGQPETLAEAARAAGLDPERVAAGATSDAAKAGLFANVAAAKAAGVFGAPTFVTEDGSRFWGDAQLRDAFGWERAGTLADLA